MPDRAEDMTPMPAKREPTYHDPRTGQRLFATGEDRADTSVLPTLADLALDIERRP